MYKVWSLLLIAGLASLCMSRNSQSLQNYVDSDRVAGNFVQDSVARVITLTVAAPAQTVPITWSPLNTARYAEKQADENYDGCQEVGPNWSGVGIARVYQTESFMVSIPASFTGFITAELIPVGDYATDSAQVYGVYVGRQRSTAAVPFRVDLNQQAYLSNKRGVNSMAKSQSYQVIGSSGQNPLYEVRFSRSQPPSEPMNYLAVMSISNQPCQSAFGDPEFVGLTGQHFLFTGTANNTYHLFSDDHISINTQFGASQWANQTVNRGTIMTGHGIRIGNSTFTFNTSSLLSNHSLVVNIDGVPTEFADGYAGLIDNCIKVEWEGSMLNFATPTHGAAFTFIKAYGGHFQFPRIDFQFEHPVEYGGNVGGLIGQTVSKTRALDLTESNYITSDLLSLDAKTNVFQGAPVKCDSAMERRRSARAAAANCGFTLP